MSNWTLFSNHGHVLVCLARNPQARLRDVASDVGITERAVQKIVSDLQSGGMVKVSKHGRRNHYRIHPKQTLRHDLEANCTLGELLKCVNPSQSAKSSQRDTEKPPTAKPVVTVSVASEPVKSDQQKPSASRQEQQKTVEVEEKPGKPGSEESIEKQQGWLF